MSDDRNPKRRAGRPPAEEASAPVLVRLPARTYDAAYKAAARDDVTVPELLRRALRAHLAGPDDR